MNSRARGSTRGWAGRGVSAPQRRARARERVRRPAGRGAPRGEGDERPAGPEEAAYQRDSVFHFTEYLQGLLRSIE